MCAHRLRSCGIPHAAGEGLTLSSLGQKGSQRLRRGTGVAQVLQTLYRVWRQHAVLTSVWRTNRNEAMDVFQKNYLWEKINGV